MHTRGYGELVGRNVDFHGDLVRNIPGIRSSQDLFDDLSEEPADWDIAIAAEAAERIPTQAALVSRPFDYGSVVTYSFDSAHWQATRFSDGTRYGVWYGSLEIETTVCETAWHWYRFVTDSFAAEARPIVTDRRLFDTRCDALLVDLRGREKEQPELVSRRSYVFTHKLGAWLHDQDVNGLATRSARCEGDNVAVFRPMRLANVRERGFLTYRLDVAGDRLVVERTPARRWLELAPSKLG